MNHELIGKVLEYDYGNDKYEIEFKSENELRWAGIAGEEKGQSGNEKYLIHQYSTLKFFVSWIETNGMFVAQHIDLGRNIVNTFLIIDKEIITLYGTINEKNATDKISLNQVPALETGDIGLMGKVLKYDYDEIVYQVTFKTETILNWNSGEVQADETYYVQKIDENKCFVSWVEVDGSIVGQIVDLKEKMVTTALYEKDEHMVFLGTIEEL